MSTDRQIALGAVGLLLLVAAMAWLFIWPGYREAASVRGQVITLRAKIAGLGDEHQKVTELAEQVDQARRRITLEYKAIPDSPEVAELIRKLSLPVDGVTVMDQTFTAGAAEDLLTSRRGDDQGPAANAQESYRLSGIQPDSTLKAMPLKVEMTATFDSIFALMRAAESMDRLMRIASLKVICKRDDHTSELAPMLNATVGLEAVYEPPPEGSPFAVNGEWGPQEGH